MKKNNLPIEELGNYEVLNNIGNGTNGIVLKARHKQEDKFYAIKKINLSMVNSKEKFNIENEIKILKTINHPNIIKFKESFSNDENLFIVTSYCDGGNMFNMIKGLKGSMLDEKQIIMYCIQIGLALSYLHDNKILHKDLKTENIFLDDGKIKIGDLGLAKNFYDNKVPTEYVRHYFKTRWRELLYI